MGQPTEGGRRLMVLFTMNGDGVDVEAERAMAADRNETGGEAGLIPFGGSYKVGGQAGTEYKDAESNEHGAGKALAWTSGINDGPGNGMLMRVDASGYESMWLRFDARSTKTGSPFVILEGRIDGRGAFQQIGERVTFAQDSAFHEHVIDLSAVSGMNGAASVELRWVFAPGTGGNGTTRIDNVELRGVKRGS